MRIKEFLSVRGIEFDSVNVHGNPDGMAALAELGLRTVPVVSRGREYVIAQSWNDVSNFLGLGEDSRPQLSPATLVERLDRILAGAQRFVRQIPAGRFEDKLPNRNRSYRELAHHVFRVPEAFAELMQGAPLTSESLAVPVPDAMRSPDDVARFGDTIRARVRAWWDTEADRSLDRRVTTYYGEQPLHEVLERTTWHAGQHVRQIMMVLEKLGVEPDARLTDADFAGLPMPTKVWDD